MKGGGASARGIKFWCKPELAYGTEAPLWITLFPRS